MGLGNQVGSRLSHKTWQVRISWFNFGGNDKLNFRYGEVIGETFRWSCPVVINSAHAVNLSGNLRDWITYLPNPGRLVYTKPGRLICVSCIALTFMSCLQLGMWRC